MSNLPATFPTTEEHLAAFRCLAVSSQLAHLERNHQLEDALPDPARPLADVHSALHLDQGRPS